MAADSLDFYQVCAHETSHNTTIAGDTLLYPALGLCGEAGELANKIKKVWRDSGGYPSIDGRNAIIDELGDVMWYVAEMATQLGVNLSDVAERNLLKLASRQQRGVIGGSGDNR